MQGRARAAQLLLFPAPLGSAFRSRYQGRTAPAQEQEPPPSLHQGLLGSCSCEGSASVASGSGQGRQSNSASLSFLGSLDSYRLLTSNREAWPRAHPTSLRPTEGLSAEVSLLLHPQGVPVSAGIHTRLNRAAGVACMGGCVWKAQIKGSVWRGTGREGVGVHVCAGSPTSTKK